MSGYENPWRDSSPSRRDRDRDFYAGSVPSGLDSTYPPIPPAKMPEEEYHGATRFGAYDTGLDSQRPIPPAPYGTSAAYASSSSFDPPQQPSPRLRDYGVPAQPSPRLRDYESRKEASPLLRDYDGRNSSSPRPRDSPSMQATGVASGINAARGLYDSFFPAAPQDDPVTPDRRSRHRPSHTPSSSSRSRSNSPDLAFGHGPSGRGMRDTGVGASPPGKTLVETMTPLASAAASAAGSALSNFFNSPPRNNNSQAPIPTRPPNDRQSSSFYDYLAAAYPMVTGNRPSQQPQSGSNNLEFAGMSLDKDWIMKQLTETNPWVLIGIAVVAIMIISSIIATLIKLAVFAAVIYLVFVFGIQNGAIQSFAAGAGREGPAPPTRRRAVDQRPGARRW